MLLHRHREPGFQLIENYCFTLDYEKLLPGARRRGSARHLWMNEMNWMRHRSTLLIVAFLAVPAVAAAQGASGVA